MNKSKTRKDVSIFSFFSGAGFLDLGFEAEGFSVDFVNEYHLPFIEGYKYSRKILGVKPPKYGYSSENINELLLHSNHELRKYVADSKKQGSIVGFIGGPPCPDFSVGGKNKGSDGENGKLSETYIELICRDKPDFFIFENVKGLWQTKRHREFYEHLKTKLTSNGYVLNDTLINAIEFGAPQDRSRIILFGVRKEKIRTKYVNHDEHNSQIIPFDLREYAAYPHSKAFGYPWVTTQSFEEGSVSTQPNDIPIELTVEYWFRKNKVKTHPNSQHSFTPRAGLSKFKIIDEGDTSKKSYKRLHRWRYSPTVCYGNNEVHLHPYLPRRLSVAEALSLQSLPAEFQLPATMSLSNMFKTVGNGVPFLLAKGVAITVGGFIGKCLK